MKGGLKWLLIAAGIYLAWRSGLFARLVPGLGPAPAPPSSVPTGGGSDTAVPPPSSLPDTSIPSGGGGATGAPVSPFTPQQIDEMTVRAAGGDMASAAILTQLGVTYNGHQWNWFREQAGHAPAPPTMGLDDVMTATQYLAYRQNQGLGWLQ